MYRLYEFSPSGNCYKVRLLLTQLQIPFERIEVDITKGEAGYEALAVMEAHLSRHNFFVGDRYSIADIALYAYTHVAHEGGFDLSGYPALQAWLKRIAAQPRHIAITD